MTQDMEEFRAEAKYDDIEEFNDGSKDDNIALRKRTTSQAYGDDCNDGSAKKRI